METKVLIERLEGVGEFLQSKRCESKESLQLALALGLIDILIIGCRQPNYSSPIIQKINQMLNKVKNKIDEQDFEGVSKLFEIMSSTNYPIGTHDTWLSLYLTENFQGIVDRLIKVFDAIFEEILKGSKNFLVVQKNNDERIELILKNFCKSFNVVIKFLRYSGVSAMVYSPEENGSYPTIYLMRAADGNVMLVVHERFIAAKDCNTEVFDFSVEPFTISTEVKISNPGFNLSYNLPGISISENNTNLKFGQNSTGQNLKQPSPINTLFPHLPKIEQSKASETLESPIISNKPGPISTKLKEENLSEDEAIEKAIQLLSDLILKNNINTTELKQDLQKICNVSSKLKSHESIKKILHNSDQCKSCGTKYKREDFSLIECEDLSLCMICNKCRWKNEQGICEICKRFYSEYEKEIIEFANYG